MNKLIHAALIIVLLLILLKLGSCVYDAGVKRGSVVTSHRYNDSVTLYQDKLNQVHAQVDLLQGSVHELDLVYKAEVAKKALELNVKPKHISSIATLTTERWFDVDSILKKYAKIDTVKVTKDSIVYLTKYDSVKMVVVDSLAITQYRQRQTWLKRKAVLDVISYSPGVTIKKLEAFQVKEYRDNLTVGPYFGLSYGVGGFKPQVGVGIQWSLFGFHVR